MRQYQMQQYRVTYRSVDANGKPNRLEHFLMANNGEHAIELTILFHNQLHQSWEAASIPPIADVVCESVEMKNN